MAITPQAIKDQEFEAKFRGYDTIEVKAYLELIAEEFIEQLEEVRQQGDEIEALIEEKDDLLAAKSWLEEQLASVQKETDEQLSVQDKKEDEITSLESECETLKEELTKLEEEKAEKEKEVVAAEETIRAKDDEIQKEISQKGELQKQIEGLNKKLENMDGVEADFKSTLVMAQKFSTDIKEKSEAEAQELIDIALEEAEKLRQETQDELARYPREIEELKEKRDKVRNELATALTTCLENLNVFSQVGDDGEDLFQSIELPLDDSNESNEFDSIGVDFSSPEPVRDNEEVFSLEDTGEEVDDSEGVTTS